MADYFLDSSAIVKLYVQETGTRWLETLTASAAGHSFLAASITLVETTSAITRRHKTGSITSADAAIALFDLEDDFRNYYYISELSTAVIQQAAALAKTYALRGYDAVQLAAALEARAAGLSLTLISADRDLNGAALAEGLIVENPNEH